MTTGISEHVEDAILTLTLARPERRNALTQPMYSALVEALERAAVDDAVRVIRLRGSDGHFTAGNDLNDFQDAIAHDPDPRAAADMPVVRFLHAVIDFPKPMVAQVEGNAIGLGTTLLLHCDAAVAATDARFRMPFVALGVVPEFASSRVLVDMVGLQRASRWLLLGEPFGVDTASSLGLVSQVCESPALEAVALAWCRRFAELPPRALMAARGLLRDRERQAVLHAVVDEEWRVFRERLDDPEHHEAVASFFRQRRR